MLVVNGDPSKDIRILNDKSRFAHVISRGKRVDLDRPWPTHSRIPGSKVANWAEESLTYERAMALKQSREILSVFTILDGCKTPMGAKVNYLIQALNATSRLNSLSEQDMSSKVGMKGYKA